MMLTTSGSDQWPQSPEGRALLPAGIYAFAIFGYVTATIATLLLGQEQRAAAGRNGDDRASSETLSLQARFCERTAGSPSGAGRNGCRPGPRIGASARLAQIC